MKRQVICGWMEESQKEKKYYKEFKYLLRDNNFIGFVPKESLMRFMIVVKGPNRGIAINCINSWVGLEKQHLQEGEYFVFDTAKELYSWMTENFK